MSKLDYSVYGFKLNYDDYQLVIKCIEFVRISTLVFDKSHNVEHAICVLRNASKINNSQMNDPLELIFVCLLHDVCDHKYPESISKDELREFIKQTLNNDYADSIIKIIDNISFSKEKKGKCDTTNFTDDEVSILQIVRDADRLEAIGKVGIDRCFQFTVAKNPDKTKEENLDDVVEHCHEKLLTLLPDGYITTPIGKKMALPLHLEIVEWVEQHSK